MRFTVVYSCVESHMLMKRPVFVLSYVNSPISLLPHKLMTDVLHRSVLSRPLTSIEGSATNEQIRTSGAPRGEGKGQLPPVDLLDIEKITNFHVFPDALTRKTQKKLRCARLCRENCILNL